MGFSALWLVLAMARPSDGGSMEELRILPLRDPPQAMPDPDAPLLDHLEMLMMIDLLNDYEMFEEEP